jgi:hypothetical protein
MKYVFEMTSCCMINASSFMKISTGVRAILRFFFEICEAVMLVLLMGVIYELHR